MKSVLIWFVWLSVEKFNSCADRLLFFTPTRNTQCTFVFPFHPEYWTYRLDQPYQCVSNTISLWPASYPSLLKRKHCIFLQPCLNITLKVAAERLFGSCSRPPPGSLSISLSWPYSEAYQSPAYGLPSITVTPRESSKSYRQTPLHTTTKATWNTCNEDMWEETLHHIYFFYTYIHKPPFKGEVVSSLWTQLYCLTSQQQQSSLCTQPHLFYLVAQ